LRERVRALETEQVSLLPLQVSAPCETCISSEVPPAPSPATNWRGPSVRPRSGSERASLSPAPTERSSRVGFPRSWREPTSAADWASASAP